MEMNEPLQFNNQEQSYQDKEILTIEKVLGPDSNYEQIIVDLKDFLNKHKEMIFSDYEDTGIYLTNDFLNKHNKNKTADIPNYKEALKQWYNFKRDKKIPANTVELGRFLYCNGEKELVEQIDLGHGPEGQRNPEKFMHSICVN